MITVEAPATPSRPTASRSFSAPAVVGNAEVVVTITASGYGDFGQLVETLPPGFTYVSTSVPDDVRAEGRTVRFALQEERSFTYTVSAPSSANTYSFSGELTDAQGSTHTVGGASQLRVGPVANRSFSRASVLRGARLVVTIDASGYGDFGQVVETLPPGSPTYPPVCLMTSERRAGPSGLPCRRREALLIPSARPAVQTLILSPAN